MDHIICWAIQHNAPHIFARVLDDGTYFSVGHLNRILKLDRAALLPALFAAYPYFCSDQNTPRNRLLHRAASRNSVSCLVALLDYGILPDLLDIRRCTALHVAAGCGAVDCVDALLHAGARTDLVDVAGLTALHYAATQNAESCVVALLRAGALPDTQDRRGHTPLMGAARYGPESCVSALLRGGALPDLQDMDGLTALHHAANEPSEECVSALLRAGAQPNLLDGGGRTPLHHAAQHSPEQCVAALLRAGALPDLSDTDGYTALYYALAAGPEGATRALIAGGAGRMVGPPVVARGKRGVTQSWYGDAVLYAVLEMPQMVAVLAEAGWVSPSVKRAVTPLQLAVREGNLEAVRVLIEWGADVDELGYRNGKIGWAPLHECVRRWSEPIWDLLIEKGANLEVLGGVWADVTDPRAVRGGGARFTPLDVARKVDNKAAVAKLESYGVRC